MPRGLLFGLNPPHPPRRRINNNHNNNYFFCGIIISLSFYCVTGEIKFIPVNRSSHSNKSETAILGQEVYRSHEPIGLESSLATIHLTPPAIKNESSDNHSNPSNDPPSINDTPVLQFHDTQDDDYDDDDDDDNSKEDGLSSPISTEYSDEEDSDSDVQSLIPTKRHRRRLMLLRGIGHPRNDDPEIALRHETTTSSISSSTSSSTSTSRPPKDFVIYALPEQSFWAKKTKNGRGRKGGSNPSSHNKYPATLHLDEDDAGIIPRIIQNPYPEQENQTTADSALPNSDDLFFNSSPSSDDLFLLNSSPNSVGYETPGTSTTTTTLNNFETIPTTTPPPPPPPPPPPTPSSTTTTPTPTTIPTITPSPAETLRMTLAEKKFHLGQCMRYCMDAIL